MRPTAGPDTVSPDGFLGGKVYFSTHGGDDGLVEVSARYIFAGEIAWPSGAHQPGGEASGFARIEQEHQPAEAAMPQAQTDLSTAGSGQPDGRGRLGEWPFVWRWRKDIWHRWLHLRARFRQVLQQLIELVRRDRHRRE